MPAELTYEERLSSTKTTLLFAVLAALFAMLFAWRRSVGGLDVLAVVFASLGGLFLFYTFNYRTLIIGLTPEALRLRFGVFTWNIPLDKIADCGLDRLPPLLRYGGAGIHFMLVRGRYRASFNFLEHARIVIAFRKKTGWVRDLSFSTAQPDELLRLLREAIAGRARHERDRGRGT